MLRWRLFGISFCIQPSFWLMNALWAFILRGPITQRADGQNLFTRELLIFILIWVLCTLAAVMVHELGHVLTGRIFGQPGNITLTGLGGQAVGEYGELSPWQRILVIFAGPGAGFLFVAALVVVDGDRTGWNWCMDWLDWQSLKCHWYLIDWIDPVHRMGGSPNYSLVMMILFIINLFMNIMNLFPIIPMDGGMIFKEICCLISPKHGLRFAFGVSFLLAAVITLYHLVVVLVNYGVIKKPFELYYPFAFPEISLVIFGMMTYQCYVAFRQIGIMQRHAEYAQRDD